MSDPNGPLFLSGERVYLRPVERADLGDAYLRWLNDPAVNAFLETGAFPTTNAELQRFYDRVAQSRDQVFLAIVDRPSNRHIGNIKLGPINWVHRRADLGILIGEKDFWGRGCGSEAVRLLVDYAFCRLNLHKITLGVYAGHAAAVKLYERAGFRVEGTLRQHLFRNGYHDKVVMGLLRDDYARHRRDSA